MIVHSRFDADYFERGVVTGQSLYMNYSWMPEMSLRMAHFMISALGFTPQTSVLDFGCAKGFTVRALRLLDIPAYGVDISPYAISCVDTDVKQYCHLNKPNARTLPFANIHFDWIISKDTLEHLPERAIDQFLRIAAPRTEAMFHVIPLGDGRTFTVPKYNQDATHITAQPVDWWIDKFQNHGWNHVEFYHYMRGIKENWTSNFPTGDGFFTLRRI